MKTVHIIAASSHKKWHNMHGKQQNSGGCIGQLTNWFPYDIDAIIIIEECGGNQIWWFCRLTSQLPTLMYTKVIVHHEAKLMFASKEKREIGKENST